MKRQFRVFKLTAMVLLPLGLLLLPADFFDQGRSICLSKLLMETDCYGCGMTRAIMHLVHLDLDKAYYLNKLSFVVLPLLIY